MDQNTDFLELFQSLVRQLKLSPEIAQKVLRRILQVLSGDSGEKNAQLNEEGKEREERKNEMS